MTRPERVPVVLLHALALDSSMWHAQCRALRARGHPVIAVDQRGFGGVPLGSAPASLDVVADDLAALLDARGVARAALVGASMGGYVAAAFVGRHPDRVAALALVCTRAYADSAAERRERQQFSDLVLDDGRRPALLAATVPRLVGATTRAGRPDTLARVAAMVHEAPPAAVAWAQRAIAARPDAVAALRTADVPALVIAGGEDELVPPGEPADLCRALPRGRLVTIPDAGHLPPLETPEVVNAALCDLLSVASTGAAR